jgi:hypothetical protein
MMQSGGERLRHSGITIIIIIIKIKEAGEY